MNILLACLAGGGCIACIAYILLSSKTEKRQQCATLPAKARPHPIPEVSDLVAQNGTPSPEWQETLFAALDHIFAGTKATTEQQLARTYQLQTEAVQATLTRLVQGFEKVGTLHSSLAAFDQPGISLKEMGDIVAHDPLLSSRLLKTINSPMFRTATNIKSIHTGVNILGLHNLKNMVAYGTMPYQLYKHPVHRHMFKEIWQHMNNTAIIASFMAKSRQDLDSGSLYTAGLMHDIGKLMLVLMIRNVDDMPMYPYNLDNEYDRLSTTHIQVLKIMFADGSLPDQLKFLVLNHHVPSFTPAQHLDCNAEQARSLTILFIANQIAKLITADGYISEDIEVLDQLEPGYQDIITREEVRQIFLSPDLMRDILINIRLVRAMLG